MKRVVAVFGLSGVGKSTLVQGVVARLPELVASVNAGELIRRNRRVPGSSDDLRLLQPEEIRANQDVLVHELDKERQRDGAPVLLLDGHCVIDNGRALVKIPTDVIDQLRLTALVCVHADPTEILDRRLGDAGRIRPAHLPDELAEQQELALSACTTYSVELGLPLVVVTTHAEALVATMVEYVATLGPHAGRT